MKITKERLLEIIKEEVERHNELKESRLKSILKNIPPNQLKALTGAVKAGGKARGQAVQLLMRYGVKADEIDDVLKIGSKADDLKPTYKPSNRPASRPEWVKKGAPAVDAAGSKLGKLGKVAAFNLLMTLGLEGVPDRVESYYRDVAKKLSGKKVNWNTIGAAIEGYAAQLGMGLLDLPELISPSELVKNLEVLVRSPYTAGRKMLGGKESNRESAIAVVWPNYMVHDAGPVGHASVVLIKPNGNTVFFDVGRYCGGSKLAYFSKSSFGSVGKAKYDDSGKIKNLNKILAKIKAKNSSAGSMEYVVVRGCDYTSARNFISSGTKRKRCGQGYSKHFGPYSFKSRAGGTSCAVFAIQVLEAGGCSSIAASARSSLFVAPRKLIKLAQNDFDERTGSR